MAKKSKIGAAVSFTDTKRVKELIALMTENGLSEIDLMEDKSRIVLRRGVAAPAPIGSSVQSYAPQVIPSAGHAPALPVPAAPNPEDSLIPIKSPMVGTFYTAANPESDPYVSIGDNVDEKMVVCIIEAMKVFNEIHAETRGIIAKILVVNGQSIEFGQPLFLVKPA